MTYRMLLPVLALLGGTQSFAGEAPAISAKNWRTHPSIAAIRDIYTENQKLKQENKLKPALKEYSCDGPGEMERKTLRDEEGHVRVYVSRMGSDDSAYTAEHHYDKQGRLRFLFVTAGAVNDSSLEMRIYFDPSGKRLWEDRKLVSGPGYPFMSTWPEDRTARDAEKAFRAAPLEGCAPSTTSP